MAQITLDVSDELIQQLEPLQGQLPELFNRFISAALLRNNVETSSPLPVQNLSASAAYQEVLDFLISRPTSEQIVAFRVSDQSQTRLQSLLKKNRDAALSQSETNELNTYEQLDTLMGLLKAKALAALRANSAS